MFQALLDNICQTLSCDNKTMCKGYSGCVPVLESKTCGSPPSVPNAEASPAGPFPVGHTHNYTCNYTPRNESYTTCQEDGKWSNAVFQCLIIGQNQSRALCSSMGFTVVGTSWCYFFNDTTLTYDMAKANCIDRGMEMPMIESESEWNALLEHIDFKNYWIGGYANDTGGVREWFWENHQKIGPFRPWADGKPDNTMDTISAIASFQRGWDDIPTNWLIPLMCEKKINFE
uniref:Uncharacterized protein LOC111105033 n=1 Tax=Crassostrea virginica TaxID=6565 RepID=A0A8B8AUA4_CRAVI|nr:uncharacterized protein LOC111105033 [Crassostrea virginica]